MHVDVIKRENQTTSQWTGGTTTQLAIFPPTAAYAKRNFLWRLSSAVVELEESTFTSLPGISRKIMVLEGQMSLDHEQHHAINLVPYDQDSFEGSWTTHSRGKVRDFNLMMAAGCTGTLLPIVIGADAEAEIRIASISPEYKTTLTIYCVDGRVTVSTGSDATQPLDTGDLLILHAERSDEATIVCMQNLSHHPVHLVQARICY